MVVALLVGVVVGLIATGLVVVDTVRRGLPARTQVGWIGFVSLVSIGGSLAVAVADDAVFRLIAESEPAVPITLITLPLLVGALIINATLGVLAVLAYGVGSRYGPFKPAAKQG